MLLLRCAVLCLELVGSGVSVVSLSCLFLSCAEGTQLWAKSTSILHLVRSFRPLAQQEFIECSTECRTGSLYTNLVVVMTNLSFSTALNDNSTALNDKSRK